MIAPAADLYRRLYAGDYMRSSWQDRAQGLNDLLGGAVRVLEVGAGRGQVAMAMSAAGLQWTACDPSPTTPWVAWAALPCLPYPDHAFEMTVAIDVLEHLAEEDIGISLAELRRVAPRGIWAVANMSDVHLVDGEPTELHLTRQPAGWWIDQVRSLGGRAIAHPTSSRKRFWLEVIW